MTIEPTPTPTPTPTPEEQNLPASPKDAGQNTAEERTGFFNRVRQNLDTEKTHPSEEQEIVVGLDEE